MTVRAIERTLNKTNEWILHVMALLDCDDHENAYAALRSVLHALRERLPLVAGTRLAEQLPLLLRGVYYDGWKPERGPVHTRSLGEFLVLVERDAHPDCKLSPEETSRAIFCVMDARIERSEMRKIVEVLPIPVQGLFPMRVQPSMTAAAVARPLKIRNAESIGRATA